LTNEHIRNGDEIKLKEGNIISENSKIKDMLDNAKTIAVLGLSPKPGRDSNMVARYLQKRGYKIIPVRPGQKEILGEKVCESLDEIDAFVDIVDVFINPAKLMPHVEKTIRLKPKVFWMQLTVENEKAAEILTKAGIDVVMNRCIMIDHEDLCK